MTGTEKGRLVMLKTQLAELLGIEIPVMQAGMGGVAFGRLAGTVWQLAGSGPRGHHVDPSQLESEIKVARSITTRPIGVDLGSLLERIDVTDVQAPIAPEPIDTLRRELAERGVDGVKRSTSSTCRSPDPLRSWMWL